MHKVSMQYQKAFLATWNQLFLHPDNNADKRQDKNTKNVNFLILKSYGCSPMTQQKLNNITYCIFICIEFGHGL